MDVSAAGIGHRVYEVRRALGPDARHEMPQRQFAELLNERAATLFPDPADRPRYDSSVIARIEKGERRATVPDITLVADVDPQRRGKLWLGWGEDADEMMRPTHLGPSVIRTPDPKITKRAKLPEKAPAKKKRA